MTNTETRCQHDMLVLNRRPTCGICLRLPDPPPLDDPFERNNRRLAGAMRVDGPARLVHVRPVGACGHCGSDLAPGQEAPWSPGDGGLVGDCCLDTLD